MYVRKHWFRLVTTNGTEMTLYFERQHRRGQNLKKRWWLATVEEDRKPDREDTPSS